MIKLLQCHAEKAVPGFQTWPLVGLETYVLARKLQAQKVKERAKNMAGCTAVKAGVGTAGRCEAELCTLWKEY